VAAYALMRRRALAVLAGSALALTSTAPSLASAQSTRTAAVTCVRHAMAAAVGVNGKVVWRTAMAATTSEFQTSFAPAIGATIGYWPEDGVLHALRLKDGHELWHAKQGYALNGVWLNHGVVALLTDDFGGGGLLTGLDATTGKVKWRLKIPGKGLTIDGPAVTADGGLAWVRADGQLQVIDLVTGKVRWSTRQGSTAQMTAQFPQIVTLGTRVFYLAGGRMSAYDDRTGAVAWSAHGAPVHARLLVAGGQLLVNGGWASAPYGLGSVDPALGATRWIYDNGAALSVLAGGAGRLAVEPGVPTAPQHEWMLNAATGVVAWQTDTGVNNLSIVIRPHDTIAVEGLGDYDRPALLVDRSLVDGHVLWQTSVQHAAATSQSLIVAGTAVIISPSGEFAHPYNPLSAFSLANGHPAWSIGTLRTLQADPVLKTKLMYVTTADDPGLCD
jgi:outer membrane protein assembly factor BamB